VYGCPNGVVTKWSRSRGLQLDDDGIATLSAPRANFLGVFARSLRVVGDPTTNVNPRFVRDKPQAMRSCCSKPKTSQTDASRLQYGRGGQQLRGETGGRIRAVLALYVWIRSLLLVPRIGKIYFGTEWHWDRTYGPEIRFFGGASGEFSRLSCMQNHGIQLSGLSACFIALECTLREPCWRMWRIFSVSETGRSVRSIRSGGQVCPI